MNKDEQLIEDTGIFRRYSLIHDDMSLDEISGKINRITSYQRNIDERLCHVRSFIHWALKEEGYGDIYHLDDIDEQLLQNKNPDQDLLDAIEDMSPVARKCYSMLKILYELERAKLSECFALLFNLGEHYGHTKIALGPEPIVKDFKTRPKRGAEKRKKNFGPLKEYIWKKYQQLDKKESLSVAACAQIISKKISKSDKKTVPKLNEMTSSKIVYHLRKMLKEK